MSIKKQVLSLLLSCLLSVALHGTDAAVVVLSDKISEKARKACFKGGLSYDQVIANLASGASGYQDYQRKWLEYLFSLSAGDVVPEGDKTVFLVHLCEDIKEYTLFDIKRLYKLLEIGVDLKRPVNLNEWEFSKIHLDSPYGIVRSPLWYARLQDNDSAEELLTKVSCRLRSHLRVG